LYRSRSDCLWKCLRLLDVYTPLRLRNALLNRNLVFPNPLPFLLYHLCRQNSIAWQWPKYCVGVSRLRRPNNNPTHVLAKFKSVTLDDRSDGISHTYPGPGHALFPGRQTLMPPLKAGCVATKCLHLLLSPTCSMQSRTLLPDREPIFAYQKARSSIVPRRASCGVG
jgi:hypothetical protein